MAGGYERLAQAGTRIRDARRVAGLSQSDLAGRCRVAAGTISRIERGAFEPSVATLVAISEALGLSPSEILLGGSEPSASSAIERRLCTEARGLSPGEQSILLDLARSLRKYRRC